MLFNVIDATDDIIDTIELSAADDDAEILDALDDLDLIPEGGDVEIHRELTEDGDTVIDVLDEDGETILSLEPERDPGDDDADDDEAESDDDGEDDDGEDEGDE